MASVEACLKYAGAVSLTTLAVVVPREAAT